MTRLFLLLLVLFTALQAAELHLTLEHVSTDGETGSVQTARVEPGVSGFVVRHFTPEHSAIIANAVAHRYDEASRTLEVSLSDYTGLRQNSLPKGNWKPRAGDELILAFAYSRGTLIAPTRKIYRQITEQVKSVEWMHPDTLATYLSFQGHPSPLKEDLSGFCTVATTGLLFFYVGDALLTTDCQSLSVLQISRAGLAYDHPQVPFYTRVEEIDANWFGEGSDIIEDYDAYYLKLLVENNPHSEKLYDFIQSLPSANKELLDEFDLRGNRP